MNVTTESPFGDVVREYAARSHDLDWISAAPMAECVYCGATARDCRTIGLPWVNMTYDGPSLILACEGASPYGADGRLTAATLCHRAETESGYCERAAFHAGRCDPGALTGDSARILGRATTTTTTTGETTS
jgi:hypothetical protein